MHNADKHDMTGFYHFMVHFITPYSQQLDNTYPRRHYQEFDNMLTGKLAQCVIIFIHWTELLVYFSYIPISQQC